jgi:IrrE N-terminal-like domain
MHDTNESSIELSVLASLRALIPERRLGFGEALQLAELQANRLLELTGVTRGPVPTEIVSSLPRIRVLYRHLPSSGLSFWNGETWVVLLNSIEPVTRQRFTLLHEFKHIIDHGRDRLLYRGGHRLSAAAQAERAADYFAGCALMPKRLIKRAWGRRLQRPAVLANLFGVSRRAVEVRLVQLGLTEPTPRHTAIRPHDQPQLPLDWPQASETEKKP